jgi:hypothetical protein
MGQVKDNLLWLSAGAEGVMLHQVDTERLKPPAPYFKLPPKQGDEWTYTLKIGKSILTVDGEEEIKVPAGKFKCVRVKETTKGDVNQTVTYWLAKDTGLVRLRFVVAEMGTFTFDLAKFTAGK